MGDVVRVFSILWNWNPSSPIEIRTRRNWCLSDKGFQNFGNFLKNWKKNFFSNQTRQTNAPGLNGLPVLLPAGSFLINILIFHAEKISKSGNSNKNSWKWTRSWRVSGIRILSLVKLDSMHQKLWWRIHDEKPESFWNRDKSFVSNMIFNILKQKQEKY